MINSQMRKNKVIIEVKKKEIKEINDSLAIPMHLEYFLKFKKNIFA